MLLPTGSVLRSCGGGRRPELLLSMFVRLHFRIVHLVGPFAYLAYALTHALQDTAKLAGWSRFQHCRRRQQQWGFRTYGSGAPVAGCCMRTAPGIHAGCCMEIAPGMLPG